MTPREGPGHAIPADVGSFLQAGTVSDRWRVRSPSGWRTADALPVWRKCLPANSTSKTSSSPQPPPGSCGLALQMESTSQEVGGPQPPPGGGPLLLVVAGALRRPRPENNFSFLILHFSLRPQGRRSPSARLRAGLADGIDLSRGQRAAAWGRRRPATPSRRCALRRPRPERKYIPKRTRKASLLNFES